MLEHEELFEKTLKEVIETSDFLKSKEFIQHGNTSIYSHSIQVACKSCMLAEKWGFDVSYKEMIRGALLHDYFLYDWHDKEHIHKRPHGFYHASAALKNAVRDFELTEKEKNIIHRHMFPLTAIPPRYKEAWIVCIADKLCSTQETIKRKS